MHRHGYQGKKFGRERDPRRALIKSLADSLVLRESIQTTLPKAKELSSYTEKLITKAKKGGLHNRRQIISSLATKEAAHKLVDEIAPKLGKRNSGYLRIEREGLRRGDNAQLARISFVDDLSAKAQSVPVKAKTEKVVDKQPQKPTALRRRTTAKKAEDK
jgi:large subunit ribosomal protein L17